MATASPWTRVHTSLIRNHKLIETAKDLRLKPVHLLGHLSVLWASVLEQAEDGDVSRWSDASLARYSDFSSTKATQYALALRSHGWVDKTGTIHDWLDFAGPYLIAKYKTREIARLVAIWAKHGRVYGKSEGNEEGSEKEDVGKSRFIHSRSDDFRPASPPTKPLREDEGRPTTRRQADPTPIDASLGASLAHLKTTLDKKQHDATP